MPACCVALGLHVCAGRVPLRGVDKEQKVGVWLAAHERGHRAVLPAPSQEHRRPQCCVWRSSRAGELKGGARMSPSLQGIGQGQVDLGERAPLVASRLGRVRGLCVLWEAPGPFFPALACVLTRCEEMVGPMVWRRMPGPLAREEPSSSCCAEGVAAGVALKRSALNQGKRSVPALRSGAHAVAVACLEALQCFWTMMDFVLVGSLSPRGCPVCLIPVWPLDVSMPARAAVCEEAPVATSAHAQV